MPAGRVLEVRYEEAVADLEGEAQRLVAHCGLKWDERRLAFHETEAVSATASPRLRRPMIVQTKFDFVNLRAEASRRADVGKHLILIAEV
jgi:hypothetical protein